jgi:undecaprenyl diphosphate synthase
LNSNSPPLKAFTLNDSNLPFHIAVIMDGNGRWAKKRLMNRINGHEKGADTVRVVIRTAREIGIRVLTLFAFSTENWQRPKTEVRALMGLLSRFLESEKQEMLDNQIRLNAIGQIERLPRSVLAILNETMSATRGNTGMLLNLSLSYGGRAELVRMAQTIATEAAAGRLDPQSITEKTVGEHLYTSGMRDPDLLIRTGGEMRVSNFLLWQIAYTELIVTKTLWPDFSREEFLQSILEYQRRERRFGKVQNP